MSENDRPDGQIEVLVDLGISYVRLADYRAMQHRYADELAGALARAQAAERERDDANIEVAINQSHLEEVHAELIDFIAEQARRKLEALERGE